MVAQIVSQILKNLGSILTEEVKRRGKLVVGAEKDVKKLTSTFSAIQSLLLDAEERQLRDEAVRDWVTKLNDICFDIDDVLDEWRTAILKEGDQEEVGNYGWLELKLLEISNILTRVCPFLPGYCFSGFEIGVRYDIASRIKELNEDLEGVDRDKNMFHFSAREFGSKIENRSLRTGPNISSSGVEGREVEMEMLRGMLLVQQDSSGGNVQSVSIQGIGGLGKTTLAKLAYNDEDVKTYFDTRIWVCVSDTFDQKKIVESIIESLSGDAQKDKTLSKMLEDIHKMIKGKRFLLVLDDAWEHSRSCWEELLSSISSGLPGSKILVTTRKGEVSRALDCIENNVIVIGKLSEDACRAIFARIAFHGWTPEERERVEDDVCGGMLKKCGGSPLAVKVLAGVLRSKKSRREWLRLLKSEMWRLKEVKEEVFGPLALSYYDLDPELRQCFQFCAVFPKDYEIEKDQLVKVWIAQGFVRAEDDEEVEDVGEEYFQILTARSFFQDVRTREERSGRVKTSCKMHDLVHDFAQLVSKNECSNKITVEDATTTRPIAGVGRGVVRNLMIQSDRWRSRPIDGSLFSLMMGLRSFMASGPYTIEPSTFDHLRRTRSLVLGNCRLEEIPSTINQLIHLRLLDVRGNGLKELPDEICELYNLWALILNKNVNLTKVPLEIGTKLVNLTHFENLDVPAVLPRSIGRLASRLKTLNRVTIDPDQREESATIVDLEDMNQLRGTLVVYGLSNVAGCDEVERAHFAGKTGLNCLRLTFRDFREGVMMSDRKDEELLEAVRPSTNLEELKVERYEGASISPSWMMSLTILTRIEITSCKNVECLPSLGGLPSLEELSFEYMPKVRKVGAEFSGQEREQQGVQAFPRLTTLRFDHMENWDDWDVGTATLMPQLRNLSVTWCRALKKLPDSILRKPTLEHLAVHHTGVFGINMFNPKYGEMPSSLWEKISHIRIIALEGVDIRRHFKSQIDALTKGAQ